MIYKYEEPYIGHKLLSCTFKKPFETLKDVQQHCKKVKLNYYLNQN